MLAARLSPYVCDARLFRYSTRSEGRDPHWTGVPVDGPTLHGRTLRALAGFAARLELDDNTRGTNPRPGADANRDCCSRSSSGDKIGLEDVVATGGVQFAVEALATGRLRWAHVWPTTAYLRHDQLVESVEGGGFVWNSAGRDAIALRAPSESSSRALRNANNQGFGSAAFNSIR